MGNGALSPLCGSSHDILTEKEGSKKSTIIFEEYEPRSPFDNYPNLRLKREQSHSVIERIIEVFFDQVDYDSINNNGIQVFLNEYPEVLFMKNQDGKTLLELAARNKNFELLHLLMVN